MNKSIKSNDLDALDAAFAEKVAGWTDIRHEEGEDVDIDSRTIYPWEGIAGVPPDSGRRRLIPRFTRSADAVLPWLEKRYKDITHVPEDDWEVTIYYREEDVGDSAGVLAYGTAIHFPHAAVIALLRAHGVEVIDVYE